MKIKFSFLIGGLLASFFITDAYSAEHSAKDAAIPEVKENLLDVGRKMYLDGVLPSGELMSAVIQGDIAITGEQVICGTCHRRSGMGSLEGQQVVPAVAGDLLFNPMQLPTSQPQSAPILRPAYTRESLKLAIRSGLDANGQLLDPIMPRYPLDDESLDSLIDYLSTLSIEHSPGVDDKEIHFATVISDGVAEVEKKALLDVMREYVKQKNTETRHESSRAEHAPWHKEWMFKPYRKWVLHVWELKGEQTTWGEQLKAYYDEKPVYAVISGAVEGPWEPVHQFCESTQLPCLFPTTDLPVIAENDFYSLYTSRGMALEGEGIASDIKSQIVDLDKVIQVYLSGDIKAETAATALETAMRGSGVDIEDLPLAQDGQVDLSKTHSGKQSVFVIWGDKALLKQVVGAIPSDQFPQRLYLSTTLSGVDGNEIPESIIERTYFIHPQEMPEKLTQLLIRSTGWFRAKRIYSPAAKRIQANAYFALKAAGGALKLTRGYFFRDYFVEKIENMVDNANYTSVYPRISLAPDQRFLSKGYYIAKASKKNNNNLEAVTEWSIP